MKATVAAVLVSAALAIGLAHAVTARAPVQAVVYVTPTSHEGPCPATFTFVGKIIDEPMTVRYRWIRSDAANAPERTVQFTKAGSTEVRTTWRLGAPRATLDYEGWMAIKVLEPADVESERAEFSVKCR